MFREEMNCSERGKGRIWEGFLQVGEAGGQKENRWMEDMGRPGQSRGAQEWRMSRERFTRLWYVVWKRTLFYVSLGTRQGQGGAQVTCVKTSHTHEAMGGFTKHHVEYTEEWPKREYPEQRQGHTHGNLGQRQWEDRRHTGETRAVRCENCQNIQFWLDLSSKMRENDTEGSRWYSKSQIIIPPAWSSWGRIMLSFLGDAHHFELWLFWNSLWRLS